MVDSDNLRRHCLGVEAAMRFYARKLGEDEEKWAITGLLHDFDYEKHPQLHPAWGVKFLEMQGWPLDITRAIASHNRKMGVPRETAMEKHLFACDEMTGFIAAVTYVRPSKSVHDVEVNSVMKKLRLSAFAAGVNREEIRQAAEDIGISIEEHVGNVLEAMKNQSEVLGLSGTAAQG